jgi:hypothetical protein
MASDAAGRMLKALEPLVGQWTMVLRGPDDELWPGQGQEIFMWHESGVHLVQRITIDVPDVPDTTAIIGCGETNATFSQLYSDERAVRRMYSMTLSDRRWTLERNGEPFPQRFRGDDQRRRSDHRRRVGKSRGREQLRFGLPSHLQQDQPP